METSNVGGVLESSGPLRFFRLMHLRLSNSRKTESLILIDANCITVFWLKAPTSIFHDCKILESLCLKLCSNKLVHLQDKRIRILPKKMICTKPGCNTIMRKTYDRENGRVTDFICHGPPRKPGKKKCGASVSIRKKTALYKANISYRIFVLLAYMWTKMSPLTYEHGKLNISCCTIKPVSRILHHSHPYFKYEVIMKYIW